MNLHVDPRVYMNQSETFKSSAKAPGDAKMQSVCAEFEAIMLQLMFKSMRSEEPSEGIIESSNAQMIFQDLLDGRIAQELAHQQSLGVGEQVYRQLAPTGSNDAG